ncbi:monovalent cation/H+ antiporter subunit D [Azoarcus indigens]|uniref:Multisubunit potassium/proton antiporter PhaD subunit n=1 Tax=Azoarcus indigens TaxID=29545 RepID=A0A4R6DR62_9RHOO|nr:monovalent cation/H+ antiporter subunit D [Azoarcus indigens]NMG67854.1 monovalent cation/H+ antiporter subunit D [Azoarcus indigens]TDN46768.1 multisubunit potassium/proton antiporter PhaD subunit [Azoarcus indigens]
MSGWTAHLPVLPVVLPLIAGAAIVLIDDGKRPLRALLAVLATLTQLGVALWLAGIAGGLLHSPWGGEIAVYAAGNWAAPFGIVLVVDRLSALLLVLTAALGLMTLLYSLARWDRAGVNFLPLFQFLLMGLNGAFLTGDLFNLFVFFEVLLAASYGLLLHGSGAARVRAGLHYIAVNLVASLLFLLGAALIYGVAGTLNLADIARKLPALTGADRSLFDIGAVLLGIVFLVKAAAWPLNFWLTPAYSSAAAPVAGVFALMTKVGVYALLRLGTLFEPGGRPPLFGGDWLFYSGLATIATGAAGMLAAQQLGRLAGHAVIVSSGTLLAAIGLLGNQYTPSLLLYLCSSVLATGAFFMLIEMVERNRSYGADLLAVSFEAFGLADPDDPTGPDDVVGIAIPAAMAFLGLSFVMCALLITGLPPLSGFVAKFGLIAAALEGAAGLTPVGSWALIAALLLSGLAGLIALTRNGIRVFWSNARSTPRLQVAEAGPVAALLLLCVALAALAGPAMDYLQGTAATLHAPERYIDAVLQAEGAGQ